jgi:RNA polymerase sigma-70 factor (ECF subfamily)
METVKDKMINELNDDELVNLYKQGAKEAFAEIYKRYGTYVFNYALSITRIKDKSEDIAQEVFMRFIDRITEYTPQGKLKNYLLTATRNRSFDWIEKERTYYKNLKSMKIELVKEGDDAGITDNPYEVTGLNSALSELPDEQREVVMLKTYQDMTFEEIAEMQKCPLSTALSRYQYAIKSLKKKLVRGDEK